MRHYAASKLRGEQVLTNVAGDMRVTLGRIAVASDPEFLDRSLAWGQKRRLLQLYRNSHYIAPPTVARAFIHLMKRALSSSVPPVEIVNICNSRAPSFAAYRRSKLNRTGFYVPYVFDILKGIVISRSISLRYPIGMFRLSDHKLRSTSFSFEADDIDQSNG
jgi:nucleoside-diphosphate-sugar epimerase